MLAQRPRRLSRKGAWVVRVSTVRLQLCYENEISS